MNPGKKAELDRTRGSVTALLTAIARGYFPRNQSFFSKERSVQIKHSPSWACSNPSVSSAKPPEVPAGGNACTQGCARTQHLKARSRAPSSQLNTSRCRSEREDGTSWLLAARFQTAEWKTAVQEIKSFIPDPSHGIDIWYSKDSLDCRKVFNQYRNDGHCAPVKPRAGLQTAHRRTYFSHNLKYLRVQHVSTGNVSRWNCPIKRPVLDAILLQNLVIISCME